jgi:hypothetical protein
VAGERRNQKMSVETCITWCLGVAVLPDSQRKELRKGLALRASQNEGNLGDLNEGVWEKEKGAKTRRVSRS